MGFEMPWRRIATGGAVLLLHLLILLGLLAVTRIPLGSALDRVREIVLTLAPPPAPKREPVPQAQVPLNIPEPDLIVPQYSAPHAITTPPLLPAPTPQSEGDIRALGRYLANCSGAYYEQLSPREKENCLLFKNDRKEQEPVLGAAKPSPFDVVITKRQAPFEAPFTPCDPSSINASLHNVPCTNFQNSHSILEQHPDN